MPPKWYIAGPFFNPAQTQLIQNIEEAFIDENVPFFSPRQQSANKKGKLTDELAKEIFSINLDNILDCECILAVVDWKLPQDQAIMLCDRREIFIPRHIVNLPDSGTVFEMGFAYRENLSIVGYTERPPEQPVNIMLSQCMAGLVRNIPALRLFLNSGDIQWGMLKKYEGAHQ